MGAGAWGPIRQVAYMVEDIDSSVDRWAQFAAVGPWTVYRNVTMVGNYRGQPTQIVMDVGLSYRGDLQIELISPKSRSPSPYQDDAAKILVGMHHIAWMTDDLERDKSLARDRGLSIVFEAENPASKVAYFASDAEPGMLLEFMQTSQMLEEGFALGVAASRDWDGRKAILAEYDFGG